MGWIQKPVCVALQAFGLGLVLAPLALADGSPTREQSRGVLAESQATVARPSVDPEYDVAWLDTTAGWQATNRAHGFRALFGPEGVRVNAGVATATAEGVPAAWSWEVGFHRWGRTGALEGAAVQQVRAQGTRVEYDRGALVEWYVNEPRGLKHGFEIPNPPSSSSDVGTAGGLVHIDLALRGTLHPVLATDGQSVDFASASGLRPLRYGDLVVTDAEGRLLRSWMEVFSEGGTRGIRVAFEDAGASYPVTIDPLATSPAWVGPPGRSVDTAGDVNGDGYDDVIVGGFGIAYVFHGSASGLASTPAVTLVAPPLSDEFGLWVSTVGDVNGDGYDEVAVGDPLYDGDPEWEVVDLGRAFVYHGSAAGTSTSPAWQEENDQMWIWLFGLTINEAGDVDDDGYGDVIVGSGATTFVFHGSASGLSTTAAWMSSGRTGSSAGDVNGDGYDDVVVGSGSYSNGESEEGGAFVYHGSATGLSTSADWSAESDHAGANFGDSAASAGDVNGDGYADLLVGAPHFDNGEAGEGRAYLYPGSAGGLASSPSWTAELDHVGALFPYSVSTAGDVDGDGYDEVIAGAPSYSNGENFEGIVVVYGGSASGPSANPFWSFEGSEQNLGYYGVSVSTAGDVNGDGFADVIAGALGAAGSGAFVYHGSAVVSNAGESANLRLAQAPGGQLALSWDVSCLLTDTDYAIYEGVLGSFASRDPLSCGTGGATTSLVTPSGGDTYYLVVPHNGSREGSYGRDGQGVERIPGPTACLPQSVGTCPR